MSNSKDNLLQYPLPYKVVDGCLYKEVTNKSGITSKKLCNFLPYIVSEVSVDDGAEVKTVLRLGGVHSSGRVLPEIDVTGAELGTFNWLIERWGADCVLEPERSVKEYVRHAIQQTAENGTLRSCMLAYTEWIKTRFLKDKDTERSFVNQLKKSFHNYRQEFINSGIRCHGRVPEIYAWLMIGMEYFLSFLFEHDAISEEEYQATFIQCRDCLYELAKKQSSSIEQDEAFSISKNGLIKALAEEGMTICDKGKNTKSIRLGDKTLRFICLIKDKADAVAALAQ